ncbi:hypothetical protein BH09SUM1_BH09SUM1_16920 [soil metagenome]
MTGSAEDDICGEFGGNMSVSVSTMGWESKDFDRHRIQSERIPDRSRHQVAVTGPGSGWTLLGGGPIWASSFNTPKIFLNFDVNSSHSAISCSQMRMTRQPSPRRVFVTIRSRLLLPSNFFSQNVLLFAGIVKCSGQQCQKHPSAWNSRSGHPRTVPCGPASFQRTSCQSVTRSAPSTTPSLL